MISAFRIFVSSVLISGCGILQCARAEDSGRMLKVFTREEGGVTHLYLQNLQIASVTATLELHSSNISASAGFPFTTTLAGNQTLEAFTLAPVRKKAPWNYSVNRSSLLGSATAVHDDSCVYLLPYAAGGSFLVSQGYHGHFSHSGPDEYAIDWQMPVGTPVHAAREGLVVQSKDDMDAGGPNRKFESSANCILIQHPDGTIGIYGHLEKGGNKVKMGDRVKAGDLIGLSGNTGFSNGPHLHFAVFKTSDGSHRASLPVKFRTVEDTTISLIAGKRYTAAPPEAESALSIAASSP